MPLGPTAASVACDSVTLHSCHNRFFFSLTAVGTYVSIVFFHCIISHCSVCAAANYAVITVSDVTVLSRVVLDYAIVLWVTFICIMYHFHVCCLVTSWVWCVFSISVLREYPVGVHTCRLGTRH